MRHIITKLELGTLVLTCVAGVAACGGGERKRADTGAAAATAAPGTVAPGAATSSMGGPTPGPPPAGATPQMVALGDSIFHGQAAGGLCFTCHGMDAKGGPLAPPLVKHEWKTGDGSYEFIIKRVTEGMPNPTPPYTSPMPPRGGSALTDEQVKAVSAYVYSISHP